MERRPRRYLSPLGFFGLSPEYKRDIHEQIFQIIFYSKGGFTFSEIYNLPVYLRQFYFKRLIKEYQEEKKAYEKAKSSYSPNPNVKT